MPYDSKLDECLFTESWEKENGADTITVSVYSYNKGAKKLQITRAGKDKNGELRYGKLGRMSKDEIEGILPIIQKAIQKM
ncbi:MAG TPA: hypothetical protein PKY78_06645 [Candidatus Omnitrophota bacterium]|nr:hypothetical protein [Candidatus Omnitrophota bacterium]HPS20646.1 hypothetical protein [Candidatus Omnitrophota bacterium]